MSPARWLVLASCVAWGCGDGVATTGTDGVTTEATSRGSDPAPDTTNGPPMTSAADGSTSSGGDPGSSGVANDVDGFDVDGECSTDCTPTSDDDATTSSSSGSDSSASSSGSDTAASESSSGSSSSSSGG